MTPREELTDLLRRLGYDSAANGLAPYADCANALRLWHDYLKTKTIKKEDTNANR